MEVRVPREFKLRQAILAKGTLGSWSSRTTFMISTIFLLVPLLLPRLASTGKEALPLTMPSTGVPRTNATPEGAACELAFAFITLDSSKFANSILPPRSDNEYARLIKSIEAGLDSQKKQGVPFPHGPGKILKVFKARHLSKSAPSSYAYAVYGLADVMFCDVIVENNDHTLTQVRTLVVKDDNAKWLAVPNPLSIPLLSAGLNDESPSQELIFSATKRE